MLTYETTLHQTKCKMDLDTFKWKFFKFLWVWPWAGCAVVTCMPIDGTKTKMKQKLLTKVNYLFTANHYGGASIQKQQHPPIPCFYFYLSRKISWKWLRVLHFYSSRKRLPSWNFNAQIFSFFAFEPSKIMAVFAVAI